MSISNDSLASTVPGDELPSSYPVFSSDFSYIKPSHVLDVVTVTSTAGPEATDDPSYSGFYSTVISTQNPEPTSASTPPSASASSLPNGAQKHNHTGVIAGPIVGVLGGLIVLVIIFYCLRHFKRKKFLAEQQEFERQFEEEKSRLAAVRKNTEQEKMGYRGGYQMHSTPWASSPRNSTIPQRSQSFYNDTRRSSDLGANAADFVTPPGNVANSDNIRILKRNSIATIGNYRSPSALEKRRSISYGAVQSVQGRPLAPIPGRRPLSISSDLYNGSNSGSHSNDDSDETKLKQSSTESSSELLDEKDKFDKNSLNDPFVTIRKSSYEHEISEEHKKHSKKRSEHF